MTILICLWFAGVELQWGLPRPDELIPLPEESEFFLLPGRQAVGLDPETGLVAPPEGEVQLAVAAFAAPLHFSGHPAYESDAKAPLLPLFAYGAVGFARAVLYPCPPGRYRTWSDFSNIPRGRIEQGGSRPAARLSQKQAYPAYCG